MTFLVLGILIVATILTGVWALGIVLWSKSGSARNTALPTVTVIVAARNEEDFINRCLNSLLLLDYPAGRLQIRIVDDHSADRTRKVAEACAAQASMDVRVLQAPPCPAGIGPKKHALRHGIENSTGEILLFTDADCTVQSGWARALVAAYGERTGAVASAVLPGRDAGLPKRLYRLERLLVSLYLGFGHRPRISGLRQRWEAFPTAGRFMRKSAASLCRTSLRAMMT